MPRCPRIPGQRPAILLEGSLLMSLRQKTRATTVAEPFPWLGLFTLAGAIFVCVTSEFLPSGLNPELAVGLGVPEAQIGFLVTIYAGTVVVTTPLLAALTRRAGRKQLVVVVLAVFALTNIVVAIAPDFATVAVARVVGGLAHGLFWAVVGAYGAHLVRRELLPRAIAITSAGATSAFVLGIPVGTALGQALGWRMAFVVMAAAIAVLIVLVLIFLPPVRHGADPRTGEIALPTRRDSTMVPVVVICVLVAVVLASQNIFYTYIVPFYQRQVGLTPFESSVMLFVFGGAGVVSLLLVAFIASRYPRASLPTVLAVAIVAVLTIGLLPERTPVVVAAVVLWGVAFGCVPMLFQTRAMQLASRRVRDMASAWLTVAFNVGIGGGAFIGGLVYSGAGLEVLPFVGAAVLALGLTLVLVSGRMLRPPTHVPARASATGDHPG